MGWHLTKASGLTPLKRGEGGPCDTLRSFQSGLSIRSQSELMLSGLALWDGIRVNPAGTQWKRPVGHIAQFLLRNVG